MSAHDLDLFLLFMFYHGGCREHTTAWSKLCTCASRPSRGVRSCVCACACVHLRVHVRVYVGVPQHRARCVFTQCPLWCVCVLHAYGVPVCVARTGMMCFEKYPSRTSQLARSRPFEALVRLLSRAALRPFIRSLQPPDPGCVQPSATVTPCEKG